MRLRFSTNAGERLNPETCSSLAILRSPMTWASAVSINSRGKLETLPAQSRKLERKPCTVASSIFIRRSTISIAIFESGLSRACSSPNPVPKVVPKTILGQMATWRSRSMARDPTRIVATPRYCRQRHSTARVRGQVSGLGKAKHVRVDDWQELLTSWQLVEYLWPAVPQRNGGT